MNNIRKIVQMYEANSEFSQNVLADMCNCSRTAISTVLNAIKIQGLTFKQIERITDKELSRLVYPDRAAKKDKEPLDYEYLLNELKKPHVTKMTLWREYINSNPNGYQKTQFIELLNKYLDSQKVTMHINRKPGEKMYVDWTGDPFIIYDNESGEEIKVHLFVSCLGCSSYPYVEGFSDQKKASFIQGHIHAFQYYQGIPLILVPDNDKSAVIKADNFDPVINETYQRMADYYGVGIIPARKKSPKDKGSVEKAVLDAAEREIIGGLRNEKFFSLLELNSRILVRLQEFSERPFQKKQGSRKSVFLEVDQPSMRPLPEFPFEYAEFLYPTVNVDYHIEVDYNYYSVPYQYLGKKVKVELQSDKVKIYYDNELIASHKRIISRGYKYQTEISHMPKEHQLYHKFSKDYFLNWAKSISPEAETIINAIFEKKSIEEQGFRSCLGIQRLVKVHGVNKFKVASKLICEKGLIKTYQNVKKVIETIESIHSQETIGNHENIRGKKYYS